MKRISQITFGATLLMGAAAITSCSEEKAIPVGSWQSSPETVVPAIQGAQTAMAVTSFDFSEGADKISGPVTITKDYTVTMPDSTGNVASYSVKASIQGTWTREDKEDDDLRLAFDQNTLSVAGTDVPDGLGAITDNFLGTIGEYSLLDDVEVSKDGKTMKAELDKPDRKVVFTKI